MPALHPYLKAYANNRHVKQFSKALYVLTGQLSSISATEIEAVIDKYSEEKGAIRRFFEGIDIDSVDQSMTVSAAYDGIESQIVMPMINSGWLLPMQLFFELPVASHSEVECVKSVFGRKWSAHPIDVRLTGQLDRIMPKVRTAHNWAALVCKIRLLYSLAPTDEGTTILLAQTGFKQSLFNKPKFDVRPFFRAAGRVHHVLEST